MHVGILGGDLQQCAGIVQPLLKIRWELSACFRIDEIVLGRRPGRGENILYGREERLRQPVKPVAGSGPRIEQPPENAHLLRDHAHPLAESRIEAADRIADRQQSLRKAPKRLEPSPYAAGQAEPVDGANRGSVLDGVINRRCPQGLGEGDEVLDIVGRRLAVDGVEVDVPSVVFDRKHEAAAPAIDGGPVNDGAPVARRTARDLEGRGCISEVDTDLGLGGSRHADIVQCLEGEGAA